MPTRLRSLFIVSLAAAGACLIGCDQDEAIRVYTAPKDPIRVERPQIKPIAWQLPAGWTQLPELGPSQFGRYATIQLDKDDPDLVVTVNQLSGPGSGDLLPNLNRWEGQLGLPASPPADAEKKAKKIEVEAHAAHRVDLTGTDAKSNVPARILAVILPEGEQAWSFMLKGPPDKVARHEAAFDSFISSVTFPGHDHSGEASSSAQVEHADNKSYTLSNFTLPSGWSQDTAERTMRFTTFYTGSGNDRAEVVVTKLPGNRFGDMLDNINRWRGEVGLPRISDPGEQPVRRTSAGQHQAAFLEFAGADRASFVAIVPLGVDVWFFKLIGPAKTVADQRGNFETFLQSLQFGAAGE